MKISLLDLYDKIEFGNNLIEKNNCFLALRIPNFNNRHIAKDYKNQPAILLSTENSKTYPPNQILENIRVEHNVKIKIFENNDRFDDVIYTVIQCTSDQSEIKEYFLRVMDSFIMSLPKEITSRDVSGLVDRLISLFQMLKRPSRKSIFGLWSELFIIVNSNNPVFLIQAWHNDPYGLYDFANGSSYVEIKSTIDRVRIHFFSLQQVYPPDGTNLMIASVLIKESSDGASVLDLWNHAKILAGENYELRLKIDSICTEVLGAEYQKSIFKCFDVNEARSSLAFYDINIIPKLSNEVPEGVTDVKFKSDLSYSKKIDRTIKQNNSIFNAFYDL